MTIENNTVLITAANRGIGKSLLAATLDRDVKRVYAATRIPISQDDPRVTPPQLDVTNTDQVAAASARVDELNVLINNAGIASYNDPTDAEPIAKHLKVNAHGVHAIIGEAA